MAEQGCRDYQDSPVHEDTIDAMVDLEHWHIFRLAVESEVAENLRD